MIWIAAGVLFCRLTTGSYGYILLWYHFYKYPFISWQRWVPFSVT